VSDVISDFFGALGVRGHDPLLRNANGNVRVEILHGEHWNVAVTKGDVVVTQTDEPADCVLSASRDVLAGLVTGEQNPVACVLRGELKLVGDWELLVIFQRVFPGPAAGAPA
jgi:putative sterol carrier protein